MSNTNTCPMCNHLLKALDEAPDEVRRAYWRRMLADHTRNFDHNKFFQAQRGEPIRVDHVWPTVNKRGG